jgi:hypothetical protein
MEIAKQQLLEFVRERAGTDEVARAEEDLPERVDTERDADLLDRFGIDPVEVTSQFNGGRRVRRPNEL